MILELLCATTSYPTSEPVVDTESLKIFTINVSIMAIAIYIVTLTIKRCLYDFIEKISILKRLYILMPIMLGIVFAIIPGTLPDDTIGSKILNGLVASFMASFLHSLVKKLVGVDFSVPSIMEKKEIDPKITFIVEGKPTETTEETKKDQPE